MVLDLFILSSPEIWASMRADINFSSSAGLNFFVATWINFKNVVEIADCCELLL